MISVVICARIRPLDCIGTPFSASLWRKPQQPNPLDLAIITPAVSIHGPKARSLSHGVLGNGDSLSAYGRAAGGWLRSRVSFGYLCHLDAKTGVLQCGCARG